MGGARTIAGCLDAGLLDALHIHLAPVLLGDGTRLFHGVGTHRLVQRTAEVSPHATHLVYELREE